MNICPICLFVNPGGTDACARCGKFKFRENGVATATAERPESQPTPAVMASPFRAESYSSSRAETSPSVLTRPSGSLKHAEAIRVTPDCFEAPTIQHHSSQDTASDRGATPMPGTRIALRPRLEVIRGEKTGVVFPVLEGKNLLGRTVHQPVDIDLTNQEPVEKVWTSRQHTSIQFDGRVILIEDLNSLNGTFVNRSRLYPGQQRVLQPNDVIQIGTVQLRLTVQTERVSV